MYLDRAVINEEAVQRVERLGSSVGMVESDVGDTATNAARAVRNLNLLDLTNGLLEVLLFRGFRG